MQSSGIQPPMPRPHSADFLEYESKSEMLNKTVPTRSAYDTYKEPQRPKSSLDINSYYDPSSDRYYSEESYAEKMRQSAQYLQQVAGPIVAPKNMEIPLAKYASGLAKKQLSTAYSQMTNNNYDAEFSSNRDNVSYSSKYGDLEALNSNWTLKEKENHKDYLNRSGSVMSDGSNVSGYVKDASRYDANPDGFMRSASARLPSTGTEKEGEKKVQQVNVLKLLFIKSFGVSYIIWVYWSFLDLYKPRFSTHDQFCKSNQYDISYLYNKMLIVNVFSGKNP